MSLIQSRLLNYVFSSSYTIFYIIFSLIYSKIYNILYNMSGFGVVFECRWVQVGTNGHEGMRARGDKGEAQGTMVRVRVRVRVR